MKKISIGTIVIVEAPGSRGEESDVRMIPAVVMKQWPDGQLQLFAFHFEGAFLINAMPLDRCYAVGEKEPLARPVSFSMAK